MDGQGAVRGLDGAGAGVARKSIILYIHHRHPPAIRHHPVHTPGRHPGRPSGSVTSSGTSLVAGFEEGSPETGPGLPCPMYCSCSGLPCPMYCSCS